MSVLLTILENAGRLIYHGAIGLIFLICLVGAGGFVLIGWELMGSARKRRLARLEAIAAGRVTPAVAAYLPPEPWSPPSRERPALADLTEEMWEALHGTGPAPHEASAAERIKGRRAA